MAPIIWMQHFCCQEERGTEFIFDKNFANVNDGGVKGHNEKDNWEIWNSDKSINFSINKGS